MQTNDRPPRREFDAHAAMLSAAAAMGRAVHPAPPVGTPAARDSGRIPADLYGRTLRAARFDLTWER